MAANVYTDKLSILDSYLTVSGWTCKAVDIWSPPKTLKHVRAFRIRFPGKQITFRRAHAIAIQVKVDEATKVAMNKEGEK